ncbi:hypothetical protein PAQ31011_01484 [Pandoraea aquatica]|uniref:Pilus assembly protein PilO n=1 Tax=Pandoraea aquatica TaxID=2508290 RepID=A0A5E4TJT4_9BURK|nr:hypothetical protein [Pandoraea aquatica]VVD88160.1 hypothetical protein PAQ31011_01484 [Pandoraea aquatica]
MNRRPLSPGAHSLDAYIVRVRWRLSAAVDWAGASALWGLAALVIVVVAKFAWLAPALHREHQQIDARQAELARLTQRVSAAAASDSAKQAAAGSPPGYALALGKVFDVLDGSGMQVADVQYQIARPRSAKDGRPHLVVTLPVVGTYLDIRRALGQLSTMPGIGIEALILERKQVADARVTARLRLTLREDDA